MKFNSREKRIISITLAAWGIFFIGSGLIMNANIKTIVNTKYTLSIQAKKIAEAQAKSNEIKLKDFEIEINTPLSVSVKDYLDEIEKVSDSTLKELKLDTSRININEAGTYEYNIIYKKKIYVGKIVVKAKELPNVTITLKTVKINTEDAISKNPRDYINETITDEINNNMTLDISQIDNSKQGDYTYYIKYKDSMYQGKIEIRDPAPTVITQEKTEEKKEQTTNTNTTQNNTTPAEQTTNPVTP